MRVRAVNFRSLHGRPSASLYLPGRNVRNFPDSEIEGKACHGILTLDLHHVPANHSQIHGDGISNKNFGKLGLDRAEGRKFPLLFLEAQ